MNINATFFAELLAFCIFVFITYRYIWPSMENLLEDRRKEISDGLEAASQSQRKLEEANKESATILDEAKAEASSLINQAIPEQIKLSMRRKTKPWKKQRKSNSQQKQISSKALTRLRMG